MQLSFFDVPPREVPSEVKTSVLRSIGPEGATPVDDLDYRITEAAPIGAGGQMLKVKTNLAAIKLLKQLQAEGRQATPEEQQQLVLYSGWGHTAQPFHPKPKGQWVKLQQELRPHFSDEEWASAAASTINAHYTSRDVIRWMWQVVEHLGFSGGKILEPAAGVGHFLGLMPEAMRARSRLWACELDLLSGAINKQLYPSAQVFVGGFETAPYEANFFDLAISNVPFADIRVHDPATFANGRDHLADVGLHNYYFIKALDLVRPGGLIAFITSRFTLDSLERKVRAYLAEHAWFLGAVRLPVDTFKKNAHTEVTTDVILLMKREDRRQVSDYSFVETASQDNYRLNEFYQQYPDMMLGAMEQTGGRYEDAFECVAPLLNPSTGSGQGFDLVEQLRRRLYDLSVFPQGIYHPAQPRLRAFPVEPETFDNPPADPWLREGSYAHDDYYRIWQKIGGKWQRAELDGRQLSRVRGLIEVRDIFRKVVAANVEHASEVKLAQLQKELAEVYRRFVHKWGYLHEMANINAFSEDADADNLLALERWDPDVGKATKAAIFTERLVKPTIRPDQADSAVEALAIALRETGRVDFARMIELTEKLQAELVEALAGKIFLDPATSQWVTADEYLSGNVRHKLQIAEADGLEDNACALAEVLPRDVGPKEIFAQLGAPWIPVEVVETFINQRLFQAGDSYGNRVEVKYLATLGYWKLDTSDAYHLRYTAENKKVWGTNRMEALTLIEKALNGQIVTIYDTFEGEQGREKRKVNQEATLVARAKQAEIKTAFEQWLWQDEGRANQLVRIYNDRFNSVIPRRYDGSHLDFPGLNPLITLRQIQKDVIWRGLQSPSLMTAHQVGFGKTFSQIGLTMRLKQMKLRQRLMLVVKRATFGQFVAAFREAYPLANISTIASGQTPQQRRRQLARIATEDFEAIITTHPILSKIPLKPETRLRFLREQVAEIEEAILEVKGDRISTKELEKAKKRLEGKIQREMEKGMARDPNALYFEDLGIDALFVDEANAYKNLWFPTVGSRISGIGGTESGRAFDMYLKIQILQERGGVVAFATGTPLENSISEVYVMMKFLIPDRLRELGLHHFDAWRATFGKVVAAVEMKPDGSGFRVKERFASFNNLPQLKQLWWQVADVQMDAEKAGIKCPKLVNEKPIGIQAQSYPELQRIIQTLANRANNLADKDPSEDNILVVISDADKASLDARLLGKFPEVGEDGEYTGEFIEITEDYLGSKVNLCADKVAEIYHATTGITLHDVDGQHNLVQLIFLDSSTPKPGEWTVYEDLRHKLIARGVKPDEIAFGQNYSSDDKKAALAAAMNAGRIRVAIGSTEVMGIGLNCQRLLVALHHLDCPWKPAWLEQREGRILRQGNLCPEVTIYRYVMGGSFDVYRWQTVERKYSFIVAFNSPDLSMLSIEDPGLAVLSAREMTALATGNPKIIEQIELQTRLRTLTALRKEFQDSRYSSRARRSRLQSEQAEWQEKLTRRQALQDVVQATGLAAAETLGAQLYDLCLPHFEVYDQQVELGQLYGCQVYYEGEIVQERVTQDVRTFWTGEDTEPAEVKKEIKVQRRVILESEAYHLRASFTLRIGDDRAEKNAHVLKDIFESNLPEKIQEAEAELKELDRKLVEVERILAEPFTHDAEIAEIETKLVQLDLEIKTELGEAEAEERQAARVDLDAGEDDASEYPEGYEDAEDADAEVEFD
jgi:N12 class adenine-specific DNA methylase